MKNPIPPDSSFRDVFPGKLALAITAWALLLCACGNASSSITPTSSMIHGLWKGSGSTSITIGADGKFSAIGLPGQIGDWSIGSIPANGDGSWRIGRFDAGAPIGVIFEFPQGSETELLVEKTARRS
jgi:hypothetical protein